MGKEFRFYQGKGQKTPPIAKTLCERLVCLKIRC